MCEGSCIQLSATCGRRPFVTGDISTHERDTMVCGSGVPLDPQSFLPGEKQPLSGGWKGEIEGEPE